MRCLGVFLLFSCIISSCAYKFPLAERGKIIGGNIYVDHSLNGKGFILSSSVFDETFQKELIKRLPQFRLVSRNEADLFMRISFKDFSSHISGDEEFSKGKVAGVNDYTNEAKEPLDPFSLEDLKTKKFFASSHQQKIHVSVELWNLVSQKKIFSKDYAYDSKVPFLFHPRSQLLEKNFSTKKMLRDSTELVATALVSDLLANHAIL